MTPWRHFSGNLQRHFSSGPRTTRKNDAGGFQKNDARVSPYTTYVKIQKGEVWSYLPFLPYDATLFGYHNTRKWKEEILSFHLRSSLSFPTMGVFYFRNPRSSTGLHTQIMLQMKFVHTLHTQKKIVHTPYTYMKFVHTPYTQMKFIYTPFT